MERSGEPKAGGADGDTGDGGLTTPLQREGIEVAYLVGRIVECYSQIDVALHHSLMLARERIGTPVFELNKKYPNSLSDKLDILEDFLELIKERKGKEFPRLLEQLPEIISLQETRHHVAHGYFLKGRRIGLHEEFSVHRVKRSTKRDDDGNPTVLSVPTRNYSLKIGNLRSALALLTGFAAEVWQLQGYLYFFEEGWPDYSSSPVGDSLFNDLPIDLSEALHAI